jgi:hypothetical protein
MVNSIINPDNIDTNVYPHLTLIFQNLNNLSTRGENSEFAHPRPHVRNMVLITSVLYTLNYVGKDLQKKQTRQSVYHPMSKSIFTHEERFEQTKKTIERARKYIPDCDIFFMECSPLSDEHHKYLAENTDYFFNLFDTGLRERMFTPSKAMGEGTLTEYALSYMFKTNVSFDNLFKFSGRYYLDDRFCYDNWNNDNIVVREFNPPSKCVFTFLYKMTRDHALQWLYFLITNEDNFRRCVGYEYIYGDFVEKNISDLIIIDCFGVEGFISPDGSHVKV